MSPCHSNGGHVIAYCKGAPRPHSGDRGR
jgi:hypothetical protein